MNRPIRILQATVSNDKGGLTGYICQNYRYINREKYQFDFLTYEDRLDFQNEFEEMGAHFFKVPRPTNFAAYVKVLSRIRNERHYNAIHFNVSYANYIPILAAKIAEYSNIIVHSHSSQIDDQRSAVRIAKLAIHKIGKHIISRVASDYWACSKLAADWMFSDEILNSKRYHLAHNAIEIEKFSYNQLTRDRIRRELGIPADCMLIGHVGRFSYQKNQEFLIKVFFEILKLKENTRLLLVGGWLNEEKYYYQVKNLADKIDVANKIIFAGVRNDVSDLMQGMDCMILPSRFEGLGIVGIEAQYAGLPCFFSSNVPDEIKLRKQVVFLSLTKGAAYWANYIVDKLDVDSNMSRDEAIVGDSYNIREEIRRTEKRYDELMEQKLL